MKTVTFLRHNRLVPPYDDYNNLTFSQLQQLAQGKVMPNIQDFTIDDISKIKTKKILSSEIVLHAPSNRATQTASQILQSIEKKLPIVKSEFLKEISFDPEVIVSPQEFKETGLASIRKMFYKKAADDKFDETLIELKERVKNLEDLLRNTPHNHILCVSHGFFLTLTKTHFEKGLTKDTLYQIPPDSRIDYLSGFTITLK